MTALHELRSPAPKKRKAEEGMEQGLSKKSKVSNLAMRLLD